MMRFDAGFALREEKLGLAFEFGVYQMEQKKAATRKGRGGLGGVYEEIRYGG